MNKDNKEFYIFDKDDNQDLQSKLSTIVLLLVLAANFTFLFDVATQLIWR